MIIGSIIDVSPSNQPGSASSNGASSVIFYTEDDAVEWARIQSESTLFNNSIYLFCAVVVINTSTGTKRWFWDGAEETA
jgi:hypothetical protein